MSTRDLVQSYYNSLNNKNDKWQELYSEDANFLDASHTLNAKGKIEVIKSFTSFLRGVESVNVRQIIVENEHACAVVNYNYINPKGQKMNQDVAEVWEVNDEKLTKLTVYFDLTAYRNFMKG